MDPADFLIGLAENYVFTLLDTAIHHMATQGIEGQAGMPNVHTSATICFLDRLPPLLERLTRLLP
jgi:hypothetical protein